TEKVLMWQTIIHIAFLLSALAIAYADRIMHPAGSPTEPH
ncbi:MAG: TIGR00645 family protein, partial [Microbacteriaceae bacterium]|nr:TIGR00645 family protein [Burkholderiaceae bacterium]